MNFNELTDDTKAKLRGCETPEELLALAREEGYELTEEELEGVNGGWGCDLGDEEPCPRECWGYKE